MFLIVKGNRMKKANNHLKKLNLKGLNSLLYANFAAKKFPDQKKEESIKKIIAKKYFFCIEYYLLTKVIKEEVS